MNRNLETEDGTSVEEKKSSKSISKVFCSGLSFIEACQHTTELTDRADLSL